MQDELNSNADAGRVDRMVMAHTPGPWTLTVHTCEKLSEMDGCDDWTIRGADGSAICMEGGRHAPETERANVALITAAPDLLAALVAMLSLVRRNAPELSGKVLGDADAAIAHATGACAP